jgi:hypothetical protein
MLDFSNCGITGLCVHHIGNRTNGEDILLSKNNHDISDEKLQDLLLRYFLAPFSNVEYYSFTFSNGDLSMNPVYSFVSEIFKKANTLHNQSIDIAKHLYEISVHPQIKAGDLFVSIFSDIEIDGELCQAIGIFKSENRQAFLKLNNQKNDFSLKYDDGINVEKLDKGCLIMNKSKEEGYKVCIIDRANKAGEAQFWKDTFLNLKPCSDDYHHTKDFLNITKNFVTKQLIEEFEVSKTDQIDYLNRSVDYFKTHESFDKDDFEKEVFQDKGVIKAFRNYDEIYRGNNDLELIDNFDISTQALKKQAKIFKSVLKLDKNFHIYIHGNKDMIEQGIEKDGRKFYKIYFKEES